MFDFHRSLLPIALSAIVAASAVIAGASQTAVANPVDPDGGRTASVCAPGPGLCINVDTRGKLYLWATAKGDVHSSSLAPKQWPTEDRNGDRPG